MGVGVPAPPPVVSQTEGELDFNDKAWASARQIFKEKQKKITEQALDAFLRESCGPQEAKQYIHKVQKEKPQYNACLGSILTKIDAFMELGDLAIKSAPESVGLAWSGIRLCLHSVQDDFATFRQYNEACGDMIGILISCTVYGGMFGKLFAVETFQEIHQQVKGCIPDIYADMLDFNYSMHVLTLKPKAFRIATGLYRSEAAKQKAKFDAIKESEAKMRKFATTASEQLTQYYLEEGLQNDDRNLQNQISIFNSLSGLDAAIRQAVHVMEAMAMDVTEVKETAGQILSELRANKDEDAKADEYECLKSLILTDPRDDLKTDERRKGKRVEGTCEWLLVQKEYTDWLAGDNPQLLHLIGDPGIGKTMISSFLVNELEQSAQQTSAMTLAYYFCNDQEPNRKTATAILRGLLLQLLRRRSILFKHILPDYKLKKGLKEESLFFGNFDALWRIFLNMLKDPDAGEIYVLIDALDECEISSRQDFLTLLKSLFVPQQSERNLNVKFLITCRPEVEIDGQRLRIDSAKVNTDLSNFINVKVDELSKLKNYPSKLAKDIKTALTVSAGGTFLWASLVLKNISTMRSTANVRNKLQALPLGLGKVYNDILRKIDEEAVDDARFILQWVVEARRPLTVHELAMACALHSKDWNTIPPADTLDEYNDSFKCCEPLLYLDTNNDTIHLIHQSAKDYLLGRYSETDGGPLQYRVIPGEANLLIFEICWRYFSMEESEHGTVIIERSLNNYLRSTSFSKEFLDDHCFLRYAAEEWLKHALAAGPALVADDVWDKDNLGKMPTLRDAWLHRAAEEGDEAIVKLLLDHEADVDAKEYWNRTALHLAAERGHKAIVKLLLGIKGNWDWMTLHLAAERGHEAVVKLLLNFEVEVDVKGNDNRTSLRQAAKTGHKAIVKLLLNHKAYIDTKDNDGLTLLAWAALQGDEEAVKLLLEGGADSNTLSYSGKTALDYALEAHLGPVIGLLASRNARTSLSWDLRSEIIQQWAEQEWFLALEKVLMDTNLVSSPDRLVEASWTRTTSCRDDKFEVDEDSSDTPCLEVTVQSNLPSPVRRIVFRTVSHDQGWHSFSPELTGSYDKLNSWTWFEASVRFRQDSDSKMSDQKDHYLYRNRRIIQRNARAWGEYRLHTNIWDYRNLQPEMREWMSLLGPGDVLQVFAKASPVAWENHVKSLEVELYCETAEGDQ